MSKICRKILLGITINTKHTFYYYNPMQTIEYISRSLNASFIVAPNASEILKVKDEHIHQALFEY